MRGKVQQIAQVHMIFFFSPNVNNTFWPTLFEIFLKEILKLPIEIFLNCNFCHILAYVDGQQHKCKRRKISKRISSNLLDWFWKHVEASRHVCVSSLHQFKGVAELNIILHVLMHFLLLIDKIIQTKFSQKASVYVYLYRWHQEDMF